MTEATTADALVDRLLTEVAADVGLDDFGDPSFRHGLERLGAAVLATGDLNPIGHAAFEGQVKGHLANRLRVTDWHRRHPAVADEVVEAPIVITGLPRTGTTALSHLLACDPANRSLLGWEAGQSVPPPQTATYWSDPRLAAAREASGMMEMLNPGFKAIHHDPPDKPTECVVLLAQQFQSAIYPTEFTVPEYDEWLLSADTTAAYAYHRSVLQVLQSECPGRWQLKTPQHGLDLDVLLATYPDARIVITHRDPVKCVASVLSLVSSLSGTFTDVDHRGYIAGHWPAMMGEFANRPAEFRARRPEVPVHDMPYTDLVSDPVGAIRAMYATFGEELSDEAAAGMAGYAEESPQGAHGRHEYRLADFGLTRADVEPMFEPYLARHDVPREEV